MINGIQLKSVIHSELTAQEKVLVIYFKINCNEKQEFSVALKKICKELKIVKPTALKTIKKLVYSGHLKINKSINPQLGNSTNLYILTSKLFENGEEL